MAVVDWLRDNPIITLILVIESTILAFWMAGVFTIVTLRVFSDSPPDIPGPGGTVVAYGTLFALTATFAASIASAHTLWRWRVDGFSKREKDSQR